MPSVIILRTNASAVRNNYIITIFDPLILCYCILSGTGYFVPPCNEVHFSLHQYNFLFLVEIWNLFGGFLRWLIAVEPSKVFASASIPCLKGLRSRIHWRLTLGFTFRVNWSNDLLLLKGRRLSLVPHFSPLQAPGCTFLLLNVMPALVLTELTSSFNSSTR